MYIMVLKLLPDQIVKTWEVIKFSATSADEVDTKYLPDYLNELLNALLNEKAQCWIRLDENRMLNWIAITRLMIDKITGEKYCNIQCQYSFKKAEDVDWAITFMTVKKYAEKEKCSYMSGDTRNKRLMEIVERFGCIEHTRNFRINIGD